MTASAATLGTVDLVAIYRDLHAHPELAFAEQRTAALVAERLAGWGYEVHTGVGGTGVVGILDNGPGPTALLRADMDALPVLEETGLPHASQVRALDRHGNEVPVMHACGHDVHVTCLLGAAAALAADRDGFAGRVVLVFQPAEEQCAGARAMVDDGLFERFGTPDVVLGQHVAPMPAGMLGVHPGTAMAASDSLTVTMYGAGGHGSRPETTVDPIVMAAAAILRLQTIVSRETANQEMAVVTVGMVRAGHAANVIPGEAEFRINVRTVDPSVRERTLASIHRIVRAEAEASGAPRQPDIEHTDQFPALVNDPDATARTRAAFETRFGAGVVVDPGVVTGSEDVGFLAEASGAPCAYWLLGGADPAPFASVTTIEGLHEVLRTIPSNHSPSFAPVESPTLEMGVQALVTAARAWLPA